MDMSKMAEMMGQMGGAVAPPAAPEVVDDDPKIEEVD